MDLKAYVEIARPSHWLKNIFVIPGVLLAHFFCGPLIENWLSASVVIGFISVCLIASSNYVLNEILDAETDKFHPEKKLRAIPSGRAKIPVAYAECVVLAVIALIMAFSINVPLGLSVLLLWIMGGAYNIPPLRLKDRPYLDVLCESINNPLRLAIGWYSTGVLMLPTLSAIAAYWMFGAFLMAVKRFAEYRHIGDAQQAGEYRKSFRHYNEEFLQISILFYAALFGMSSGIFIARYRIELVLAIPLVCFAMAQYLHVGYKRNSPVQHPEMLYRDKKLMLVVALAFVVCALLLLYDIPVLSDIFEPKLSPP